MTPPVPDVAPPPSALGLPSHFTDWRPGQWAIVSGVAESDHAAHLLIAPTGFGKSLTYYAIAALTGWRTVILTGTKALQDQLVRDFASIGLVDVRGMSNYDCIAPTRPDLMALDNMAVYFRRGAPVRVSQAPCRWGFRCPLRDGGCLYYDRIRTAARSEVVVTNYDFWLHNRHKLGRVDLLVLDEAHQAPDELADHLSFRLTADMRRYFSGRVPETEEVEVWGKWAVWAEEQIKSRLEGQVKPAPALVELGYEVSRMAAHLGDGDWVVERFPGGNVNFDCMNPEAFGEERIWGGVGRVLLVSATVNVMTAKAIGLDPASVKVWEGKSTFPLESRPVWVVGSTADQLPDAGRPQAAVGQPDRPHHSRAAGPEGIVHTTSFERARLLKEKSRHSAAMIFDESGNTTDCVSSFRRMSSGVLVSPSVTTGWDFPGTDCEYQVIGKVPFPDLRTKAAKARADRNRDWAGYQAAQTIVQSTGRGMRSADDRCESFVVDGNFGWWYDRNRRWIPRWWQQSVRWCEMGKLPEPLTKP